MADPRNLPPEVIALLKSGNKIQAIKLLRERTGLGLADAKGHVDAHEGSDGQSPVSYDTSDHMSRPSVGATRARPSTYVKRDGLSPGEVPRTNGALQVVIFVAALAAATWAYFMFG